MIFDSRLDDDIVLDTDGVIAEISSENFIDCIGGTLEEVIKKNEKLLEVYFFKNMKEKTIKIRSHKKEGGLEHKTNRIDLHQNYCIWSIWTSLPRES